MPWRRRRLHRVSSSIMLLCHAPQQNNSRVPSMSGRESGPVKDVNLCSCLGPMRVLISEGSACGSEEWKADCRAGRQLCSAVLGASAGKFGSGADAVLRAVFELNC